MLFRLGALLIVIALAVLEIIFAIKEFKSAWYSFYFLSSNSGVTGIAILIAVDMFRWLYILISFILLFLLALTPEKNKIYDPLLSFLIKVIVYGFLTVALMIGLQNLVLYNVIGWKYINIVDIGEGISLFWAWLMFSLIVLGSKFYSTIKVVIFESLFNLSLILLPTSTVVTSSLGGFKESAQWQIVYLILVSLFILLIGVDELKGKPSLYTYLVSNYHILEAGHLSLQTFRKRSAETLASALSTYKRLPLEQQEALAKWILDNSKPSFVNRFWALAKIVISTILLTTLVQEPAIIIFKWILKIFFGFSY